MSVLYTGNFRPNFNDRWHEEHDGDDGLGCFRGMANVAKFYLCCGVIFGAVCLLAKAVR